MPKTNPLDKKLAVLQSRIDRIQSLSDFLKQHSFVAPISTIQPIHGGLVGLVIAEKAFVRPQGVNKPGLKMERWLEDIFNDEEPQDRLISEDVIGVSSEELQMLLATIPNAYDPDDEEDEE